MNAIEGAYANYNWLVSEPEATFYDKLLDAKFFNKDYVWITGEELKEATIKSHQFIWGVFSGFNKSIALKDVLKYKLPTTECNTYWTENVEIQHPLAEIEVYAFDSSYTFVIARNDNIIDIFIDCIPDARDLPEYNMRQAKALKRIEEIILVENSKLEHKFRIWDELYRRNDKPINDEEILNQIRKIIY